jgi:hypothetical protein
MISFEFYYIFVPAIFIEHHLRVVGLYENILVSGSEQCGNETLLQVSDRS